MTPTLPSPQQPARPVMVAALSAIVVALYIPTLTTAVKLWFSDDYYSHCIFIFPLSAFMLWLQRDAIRAAVPRPTAWGFAPLAVGLVMQMTAYLFNLPYIGMWSIVPVIAGMILLLHGVDLWRVTRFPVGYLLLAGSLPSSLFSYFNHAIQSFSTTGAAWLGNVLGFTLLRRGNLIEVPGASLEVMMACSGYKKLTVLITFALLFGFLTTQSGWKRALLVLAAIPIAMIANCLRIESLIAATTSGGMPMFHLFHTPTDLAAVVIAFLLIMGIGKVVGCRNLRFTL